MKLILFDETCTQFKVYKSCYVTAEKNNIKSGSTLQIYLYTVDCQLLGVKLQSGKKWASESHG